jgi:glutaminyl-peptide cyclotransferase
MQGPSGRPVRAVVLVVTLVVILTTSACGRGSNESGDGSSDGSPTALRTEVLEELPWDVDLFTQGLAFISPDRLVVSSGLYEQSNLQVVDPLTGLSQQVEPLNPGWFAEGITVATTSDGPALVLLTWREGVAAWFDPVTLAELKQLSYDAEGWGICQLDDGRMVTSDGSASLTFRDADTLTAIDGVDVTRAGVAVDQLNELECDGTTVWANVWQTDRIEQIDVATGRVIAEVDASGLLDRTANANADVLNGIARIPGTDDQFLLTGKRWPTAYRVRFVP